MNEINIDAFVKILTDRLDDRTWGTGGQAHIIHKGKSVLDLALGVDGLDRPVRTDSLFPIYCAGKPLTTLAIAHLLDQKELSLDDQLGDIIPPPLHPETAQRTIAQLLDHSAGLHQLAGMFLTNPPADRDALIRMLPPLPVEPRGAGHYSEYAAWHLLAVAIEQLVEQPFEEAMRTIVLGPLNLEDDITFLIKTDEIMARLRINTDHTRPPRHAPLLWEQNPNNLRDLRPAGGAHATMKSLATLYEHLQITLQGAQSSPICSSATLRHMTTHRTLHAHDPVLGRQCTHGLGFMVNGQQHGLDALDAESFGHTGLAGMTVAFTQANFTIAVHTNSITDPSVASPVHRRTRWMRALVP